MSGNRTEGRPGGIPARRGAWAPRRRATVAAGFALLASLEAHAGDWGGTIAASSQLVDRGVAITPPVPVVQGAVNWVSRNGWSIGASASYQVRDPGRVAEAIAQVARSWSLSDDWQAQASLMDYHYPGGSAGLRSYNRIELGGSLVWRDVLTIGASAIRLNRWGGGLRGAADVGARWPLGWHLAATGGVGIAQYLAPLRQYYPSRPDRYTYGHGGLVWQNGPWRVELIHVFTNRERNRGEQRVSPWTATVARTF
ncbi:hypothetical protein [Luteibacter yeojuensis]|uniref:hypothetical protein n=1 Tax=Luteibacter yeojuensis TaxID=345309 RepID=UPI0012EE697B|nr:hypothetical protein [Luteibacter yeojuensis]